MFPYNICAHIWGIGQETWFYLLYKFQGFISVELWIRSLRLVLCTHVSFEGLGISELIPKVRTNVEYGVIIGVYPHMFVQARLIHVPLATCINLADKSLKLTLIQSSTLADVGLL